MANQQSNSPKNQENEKQPPQKGSEMRKPVTTDEEYEAAHPVPSGAKPDLEDVDEYELNVPPADEMASPKAPNITDMQQQNLTGEAEKRRVNPDFGTEPQDVTSNAPNISQTQPQVEELDENLKQKLSKEEQEKLNLEMNVMKNEQLAEKLDERIDELEEESETS